MGRVRRRFLGAWLIAAMPIVAIADEGAPKDTTSTPTQASVGGVSTIDVIRLQADGPGAPLRFGGVVPGSERVQLNGRLLTTGEDYALDAAVGVIYLRVPQHLGDTLTVSYRYDAKAASTASTAGGGGAFQFSPLPGSLGLIAGFGLAERSADGSVMTSNVFGWNNTFNFGKGTSLGGAFIYSNRQKATNRAGLSFDASAKPGDALTDEGAGQFLVQNFRTNLLGGNVSVDYQDISKNFASFGSVRQAGYAESDVARLSKERGLKRSGFAFDGLKVGGLALSNSFHEVRDGKDGIAWRTMGLQQGGLKLNYDSRRVSGAFQRFADLSEGDRDQLQRERGMSRENFGGEFAQKAGKLSFSTQEVKDDTSGNGVVRRVGGVELGKLKLGFGDQHVDADFTRMSSLTGAEQAQWGREAGIRRQWANGTLALAKDQALTFNQVQLESKAGKFEERDAAYTGKTWSLEHTSLGSTSKFASMGAMQDSEADGHVARIAKMYGDNVAIAPSERGMFLGGVGLQRDFTRFKVRPFKDYEARFESLNIQGSKGGGKVQNFAISSPKLAATFRRQDFSSQFNQMTSLMALEQQRLGSLVGLDRTDITAAYQMGAGKKVEFTRMTAQTDKGAADRTTINVVTKGLQLAVASRRVDSKFDTVGQLVDSEAGTLLTQFRGFTEREMRLKFDPSAKLKVEAFVQGAKNDETGEERSQRTMSLLWKPDNRTTFGYDEIGQKNADSLHTLFVNSMKRTTIGRDMGRWGSLSYVNENVDYDGTQTTLPDYQKQIVAYEAKISSKTSLRTEQSQVRYDNGDKEDVSSNTLSTELTKRVGVSVTDTKVARSGSKDQDEAKRNYGFWYDFGNGVRISYGYARQLNGADTGTLTNTVAIGKNPDGLTPDQVGKIQQGNIGDLSVGGAYGLNRWETADQTRTQALSNVAISTAKPLQLGLIRDLKFNIAYNSAADYGILSTENRTYGISGRVGTNAIGYEYRGQKTADGMRAIDRTFKLQTDPSEKRWIRGNVSYKMRTLPNNKEFAIRDMSVTVRPVPKMEVTNQVQTNPEVTDGNALLGSTPQAARSNKWRFDYRPSADTTIGGSWEELLNDQTDAQTTTAGVDVKLFQKSGSPLSLFYGLEEIGGNVEHRLTQRYHLQFDQRPGPNQMLSLFLGNVSYAYSVADGQLPQNWTVRLGYQIRF